MATAKVTFIGYPKCSTCQKAEKFLRDHGCDAPMRDIKEKKPTVKELRTWHAKSGLPLKRFFNTSGMIYRDMGLKDKLPGMTEEEQYDVLASDGMLVKRPLLITKDRVLTGFREKEWAGLFN
ncbi:arsenate reductase family protein [Selenomonas sp. TAMA-11512]|uniref:arsenate reductase family protein n=1 Tax=Selenomonas sp. TAMA-11512 TaxID=3095337 RepID=UPI00308F0BB4|nr:arsenate reductase family protein [Selenomonas sp. TAMA-11512]